MNSKRQRFRKRIVFFSFLFFPFTVFYFSPIIIFSASMSGVLAGSMILFALPSFSDLTLRMNLSKARNVELNHFYSDAGMSKVVGIRAVSLSYIEELVRKMETEKTEKTA